jgi:tetratricopeptide (TPR) repeat protein
MVSRRSGTRDKSRRAPVRSDRPGGIARAGSDKWPVFIAIVGLAAILRIAYTLASRQSPFFDHLDLDSRFYDLWAKAISGGKWVGDEVFFMGPLYPYFLAVIYKAFGTGLVTVKVIQGLLGGLTAGVTYLLGRTLFGAVAGIAAGFMAAMYVPFIFYDSSILLPVLATLLNILMLYSLYVGLLGGRLRMFLVAGLLAGLSAAGNASVLAFGPPAVAFLLIYGKESLGMRFRKALLFVVGAAVVVTPIMVRNLVVGHDFVPLTSNAGLNFFIGNGERAMGAYVKPEGLDIYTDPTGKTIAEADEGRSLKPSEVSAYWTGRALEFIRGHPVRFLSNLARKVFFFWSVYEVPQIEHLQFERRYSWLLRIPSPSFGIVCPLGILGIILALRRRKEAYLLLLFILAYSTTIVVFFVVARYRLPMIPALLVFAGYTVQWWVGRAVRRDRQAIVYSLIGFIALFILVHANFYRVDPKSGFAQSYYRLGLIQEKKGRPLEAIESYRQAVATDPNLEEGYVNLGILLSRERHYEEAARALSKALALKPDYAKAYYNLGLVYSEQAKGDSALLMMDRALELNPEYDLALVGKAGLLYETARLEAAESLLTHLVSDPDIAPQSREQMQTLLRLLPERRAWMTGRVSETQRKSDLEVLRADDLLSLGMTDQALEAYELAARIDSLSAVALYQAGAVYFNRGDPETAARFFGDALKAAPGYRGAHFALGVIAYRKGDFPTACREFEQEVEIDPGSGRSHINLAMCYEEHLNDPKRAAYHLERYIEITGGTEELRKHLMELKGQSE